MTSTGPTARPDRDTVVDNTNHDLIHSLSVRLDAQWHDKSYKGETVCPGRKRTFDRIQEMDREAVRTLSSELRNHIENGKFPIDLVD